MKNIVYVTGNYGKYRSVKKYFEMNDLDIDFYKYDLDEPDVNDIEFISRMKAKEAYDLLQRPCFVADSGFYIDDFPNNPGYPGAFVKRSGVSSNIEKLLDDMKNVVNRACHFLDCLTFFDGDNYYTFYGKSEGELAMEKRGVHNSDAKSNLWYLFIPKNCSKSLAEMTEEERFNRQDGHTSATEEFINWYKNEYLHKKTLIKK